MSAVSAAVSVAVPARVRRPAAQGRRLSLALRPAAMGGARWRPPAGAPAGSGAAAVLLAAAGLAAFAALCLPALRTEVAIGWLPLWLVAAPLTAGAALCLVRTRDGVGDGMGRRGGTGRAGGRDRTRMLGGIRRGAVQAVRCGRCEGAGRPVERHVA